MNSRPSFSSSNPVRQAWAKPTLARIRPTKEILHAILDQNGIDSDPSDSVETLLKRARHATEVRHPDPHEG
jgi:hypothetical protein